jgi:hypothetical protein
VAIKVAMLIKAALTAPCKLIHKLETIIPANMEAINTHSTVSEPFSSAKNVFDFFIMFLITFPQFKIKNTSETIKVKFYYKNPLGPDSYNKSGLLPRRGQREKTGF